ncbi:sigma-70 family RNA polymerase sigma factor [Allokutzneria sp. A3M-2-11 16]|uniref:sigma-70 family RNA polymerase sigma factor n=1 Tax=Allokutzneria sp. A3M-2-11 16 TaxID=2962043 RepID=UPI0020B870AC|nr:sigma-70 family RNA polymerase sigma factor [Allokutzneria sp. A3M-2-11 16]MCP3798383.1 sigma-70 family RNA polymerase sigma factor [Allokutzneria sp. A3M-2-11 16]
MTIATETTDPIRDYLREIGRTPLLTAEEEVRLGERIEAGNRARDELAAGAAERRALERLVVDGDRARGHMIRANLRLVVSIARRYPVGGGMSLLDLIQEGTIGMMRAVEKFDHRRGLKFSTYATWWIKQGIGRALADQSRTIRLPVHVVEVLNRVTRARRALAQDLGREPTPAEIAAEVELSPEKVEQVLRNGRTPVSMHALLGEDGDVELGDLVAGSAPDPATAVMDSVRRRHLDKVLKTLSEREAAVLSQRYGLDDDQPRTLDEIGRNFGLTRERIRQIEAKGMSKLRHPTRTRELADLLA